MAVLPPLSMQLVNRFGDREVGIDPESAVEDFGMNRTRSIINYIKRFLFFNPNFTCKWCLMNSLGVWPIEATTSPICAMASMRSLIQMQRTLF